MYNHAYAYFTSYLILPTSLPKFLGSISTTHQSTIWWRMSPKRGKKVPDQDQEKHHESTQDEVFQQYHTISPIPSNTLPKRHLPAYVSRAVIARSSGFQAPKAPKAPQAVQGSSSSHQVYGVWSNQTASLSEFRHYTPLRPTAGSNTPNSSRSLPIAQLSDFLFEKLKIRS